MISRINIVAALVALFTVHTLAQQRLTLRLVDWAGLDEIPLTEKAIAEFERVHPEIDVLYEPNPGRQYEGKLLTALATDSPPDVFLLDSKLVPTFTNKGVLLDLNPFVEQLAIDTTRWFPLALNIARRNGHLYAFPKGFTPLVIYYNKKLFNHAGVLYPTSDWTWTDFLETAKRLTRDRDYDGTIDEYGTAFSNHFYYWIPWVWSAGGDVVSPDGQTASGYLSSSETEMALQFLIDLRIRHGVAPEVGTWAQTERTGANSQLFAAGKIAMIVDGHWRMPMLLRHMASGNLDIGVVGLPRLPDKRKTNVMYESGWCVPTSTRFPAEAVRLAAFMAAEAASGFRTEGKLEIPAVISVAEQSAATDATGMERAFLEEIGFCRQPWGSLIERFSEIEWTLQDAVDEAMINGQPLDTILDRYVARVDAQLKNIRSHQEMQFKPIREHTEVLSFLLVVVAATLAFCVLLYLRTRGRIRTQTGAAISFLGPSLLHLSIFILTPLLFAAYLSLHQWDIVVPEKPFVGLDNFRELLRDHNFWNALKNTLIYMLNVPLSMALALTVALAMHRQMRGIELLRTLYFLPGVTSFVAVALVWMWIYHPSFGIANFFLSFVGLPPLEWLNSAQTSMLSMIIFTIWMGMGYQMVIFLAGLQGIPEDLYSAARIDGASNRQLFFHITLPLLRPTTLFILVTSVIGSFQVFTSIYVMTAGGPVRSTDVIVYHIYQAAWEHLRMGYASAMSWVLFVIIMVVTWIQFRFLGQEVEYG